jgi:hypothetical protein
VTLYRWLTWGGRPRELEADAVTFEPQHVAFWSHPADVLTPALLLAEDAKDVKSLRGEPS